MNLVDVALLVVLALAIWAGWAKGFILGTIDLVVWIGSLLAAFFLYRYLGDSFLNIFPNIGAWRFPLAFFIIIVIGRLLLGFLFNAIERSTPRDAHHNVVNHILGMLPGFITGVMYTIILTALLIALPLSETISTTARDSKIAGALAVQVEWLDDQFSPIFGDAAKQTMNNMTVEPETDETVHLSYTVKNGKVRADLEQRMLQLVNTERVKRGLPALQYDPELTQVARAHSVDMFARGYFSHYTPENKDPFDRMKASGVEFVTAGENLALGRTLSICHTGLMNSPGHRANILNKSFGRLGIGIIDGGFHGLMISQEFRN